MRRFDGNDTGFHEELMTRIIGRRKQVPPPLKGQAEGKGLHQGR
jgi:hypothetical protein